MGPNGAGKTTCFNVLTGRYKPDRGRVLFNGRDITGRSPQAIARLGVARSFQLMTLFDEFSVFENVAIALPATRERGRDALGQAYGDPALVAEALDILDKVGLADRADDEVQTYSRGMRQRLGIADALVKSPDLLILDEPTTAIDPLGVVEILDLLRRLVHERGLAILLSSHLLTQVQSVCDRIGIFASGRMVGQGTLGELAEKFGDGTATIEVGLDLDGPSEIERAKGVLLAIKGVRKVVPPDDGGETWQVIVQPPEIEGQVRQQILAIAVDKGLGLTALRPIVPSLDEIYRIAVKRSEIVRRPS
jgi:branched-chain amino acid transport system ATP-binding protein